MSVDWGQLTPTLRPGDWTCVHHGRVQPRTDTLIPACPQCGGTALQAVLDRRAGYLVHVEQAPARCANGHLLGPGRVMLGWHACDCPPVRAADTGGHRTWACRTCSNTQCWPPCQAPTGQRP